MMNIYVLGLGAPHIRELMVVSVMVCHCTGNKPLPEEMMTHFIDTYMHQQALLNQLIVG